jgi:hypothetical protein
MLGSAFIFAVLDVLIKLIGPEFRVWDIAFYRWGGGLLIFGSVVYLNHVNAKRNSYSIKSVIQNHPSVQ